MPMLMMFINQSDDPIYIPNITLVESHVLLDISNQTPLFYWRVPGYKFNFLSGFPYLPSYIPSFHIPSCKYCNGCGCHPSWARRSFSERVPDEVLHIYASSDLKWYIYIYHPTIDLSTYWGYSITLVAVPTCKHLYPFTIIDPSYFEVRRGIQWISILFSQ